MIAISLDSQFDLQDEQIKQFQEKGFVKLKKFLSPDTISFLRERVNDELKNSPSNFQKEFSRLKYDFEGRKKPCIFPYTARILSKNASCSNRKKAVFYV